MGAMSASGSKGEYSLRAHIVRFALGSGLKSDMAEDPFGAQNRQSVYRYLTSMAQATKALIDAIFGWLARCTM